MTCDEDVDLPKLMSFAERNLLVHEVEALLEISTGHGRSNEDTYRFQRLILLMFTLTVVHGSGADRLSELLMNKVLDLINRAKTETDTTNFVEPVELPLEVAEGGIVLCEAKIVSSSSK